MSAIESTATQTLPAGTWNVDPVHSQVGFAVKYMVGTFRGQLLARRGHAFGLARTAAPA